VIVVVVMAVVVIVIVVVVVGSRGRGRGLAAPQDDSPARNDSTWRSAFDPRIGSVCGIGGHQNHSGGVNMTPIRSRVEMQPKN
jgi:hypothetical protein